MFEFIKANPSLFTEQDLLLFAKTGIITEKQRIELEDKQSHPVIQGG